MSNESTERNSCVARSLKHFLSVLFLFYKSASRKLTARPRTNRYLSFWHINHQFPLKSKDFKWICRLCDELTCLKIFPPLLKRCLSSLLHITQTVVSLPLTPSHFLCDFISCSRDILIHFSISSVSFYSCLLYFPCCCWHHMHPRTRDSTGLIGFVLFSHRLSSDQISYDYIQFGTLHECTTKLMQSWCQNVNLPVNTWTKLILPSCPLLSFFLSIKHSWYLGWCHGGIKIKEATRSECFCGPVLTDYCY